MSDAMIEPAELVPSRAVEDYLKAIHHLEQNESPVATTVLATELGVSAASVTKMVKGLADQGLLTHRPYRGVTLTPPGETAALRIIRRHRVLELYLIEKLGFSWEEVHEQAERLEHAASERLIDSMAAALGEPSIDPHGSLIPTSEGEWFPPAWVPLLDLEEGASGRVREVSDRSADTLRDLGNLGVSLGVRLQIAALRADGSRQVILGDEVIELPSALVEAVFVEQLGPAQAGETARSHRHANPNQSRKT